MVAYLDYTEYTNMGGTLPEATFNDLSYEAQAVIDWYTFNRLQNETTVDERVKKLMYRLIKLLNDKMMASAVPDSSGQTASGTMAGIASQSNDGVSISYNVVSASEVIENADAEIKQAVQMYLQGVTNNLGRRVLYRGLYPGE